MLCLMLMSLKTITGPQTLHALSWSRGGGGQQVSKLTLMMSLWTALLDRFAVLRQDSPAADSGLRALPHQGPAPQQVSLETRDKVGVGEGESGFEIPSLLFVPTCSDDLAAPVLASSAVKQS